jgi:lycopene cyclase domain-containing protein
VAEYTLAAVLAAVAVVLVEVRWLRTGLFRDRTYWMAMAIVLFFQVLVDGWLTKLSAPIVRYSASELSGVRFPWDVPVEDYLFGFALVTSVMLLWERAGAAGRAEGRSVQGDPR